MKYQTILTIKESEKATVELAAVELFVGPVIVKRLKGGNPEIYRLLSGQNNPHIPQIYAVEEQENELFIAEEYVDGESLSEHLQKNLLSDEQKLNYALQLCEAVGFLHALNPSVIHRDIKPSNILINGKGELKLIDFDASRHYKEAPSSSDTRLLGTVEYAPPEQFGFSQTDVRSDIYSMGVVFHEMRPAENKKLAEQWEKIAEKCTSFDPKNRYQSVAELKRELDKLAAWKKSRKTNLAGWIGGTVVLLVVTVLLAALWPKEEKTEDVGGAKLTGVPTSAQTDVPTLTPTNVPTETPTPTLTVALALKPTATSTTTPSPTSTPTPLPTNTSTLLPTDIPLPTGSPEELERKEAEILADLNAKNAFVNLYYKGLDTGADFMFYSDFFEGEDMTFTQIQVWNMVTETFFLIPYDGFYNENNILHIKRSYLQELQEGYYRMRISYEDRATGQKDKTETYLHLLEGADEVDDGRPLVDDYACFFYNYFDCVHTIIVNHVVGKFKDIGTYRVLENGRVIEFDKEYLLRYIVPGESGIMLLELAFEDGRKGLMELEYTPEKPSYMK